MLRQLRPICWNENMPVHAPPLDYSDDCFRFGAIGMNRSVPCVDGSELARTFFTPAGWSVQRLRLFDHLVGAAEQGQRNRDAKCPGSLEIDGYLEQCRFEA